MFLISYNFCDFKDTHTDFLHTKTRPKNYIFKIDYFFIEGLRKNLDSESFGSYPHVDKFIIL